MVLILITDLTILGFRFGYWTLTTAFDGIKYLLYGRQPTENEILMIESKTLAKEIDTLKAQLETVERELLLKQSCQMLNECDERNDRNDRRE